MAVVLTAVWSSGPRLREVLLISSRRGARCATATKQVHHVQTYPNYYYSSMLGYVRLTTPTADAPMMTALACPSSCDASHAVVVVVG